MSYREYVVLSLLLIMCVHRVRSQDIETVLSSKPLEVTGGGINLSSVFYESFGAPSARPALSHYASGNLNVNLFGLPAPLSFSYTNRKAAYTQPFNNFSFAPRYRWAAARFGAHNVTYSPYTLAGHNINGASVELTPGPLTVKLAYGRLQKAIVPDTLGTDYSSAAFRRMGAAASLEYRWNGDRLYVTAFGARDDSSSVPAAYVAEEVRPQQNQAFSVGGTKQLFGRFTLDGELAASLLHRDTSTPRQKKASRQEFYAYRTNLKYAGNGYQLSMGFEHVDPNYLTLGGYYFNNDLEKITVGGATSLVDGHLNLNAQVGRERNNLRQTETNTTQRWVGALNTTLRVSPRFTLAANYSNFTAYTNVRLATEGEVRDELDTLNFYQINQTAAGSANWQLGRAKRPRTLSANVTYQTTGFNGYGEENQPGTTYGANTLSYSFGFPAQHLTVATSLNSYVQQSGAGTSRATGPAVTLGKTFWKDQLKNTWSAGYNISQPSEAAEAAQTQSFRWNLAYQSSRKREKNQQRKHRNTRTRGGHTLRKRDRGYIAERSSKTGQYLPEELSLRKEHTKKVKDQVEKTEATKKYITERHRFNLNVAYLQRDVPTAEIPRSAELTIRLSYAYTF